MDRDRHRTEQISTGDAAARFAGVVLLVVVGFAHLLDLSHKVDEGVWLMALGFVALIVLAICIAVALVRSPAGAVRLAWVAAALICVGALAGYAVSRLLPLPGMADHQGDWSNGYGVLAMLAELSLIALAAYAMRDLTLRGIPHRPPQWLRAGASGALPTIIPLLALAAMPGQALAHGGEEDEAGGSSPPASTASGAAEEGDGATAMASAHGDPFLGTTELGLALLVSLAFVAWAGRSLSARVAPRLADEWPSRN